MSHALFVALEYGIVFTIIFSIVHYSSLDSEEILQPIPPTRGFNCSK